MNIKIIKAQNKNEVFFMNEDKKSYEDIEDVSKYGEFVSSYFAWTTLEKQKQNAKEMDKMTKVKEP